MKHCVLLIVACLIFSQINAQKIVSNKVINYAEVDSLYQPIIHFFDGLSSLRDDQFVAQTTKDFLLLEGGLIWNNDTLIKRIQPAKLDPSFSRINHFTFLQSQVQGNMAWVSYWNEAKFIRKGQSSTVKWLESVVLIREENKWKIKLMHSTPAKL